VLCRDWDYRTLHQEGSHIILQTEELFGARTNQNFRNLPASRQRAQRSRLAHESQTRHGGGAPPPKLGQSCSFALPELGLSARARDLTFLSQPRPKIIVNSCCYSAGINHASSVR
jgi:hypothetical protein